jgi:hypothetical protein
MSFVQNLQQRFATDFDEQVANTLVNVMSGVLNLDEQIELENAKLQKEFEEQLTKMTDDELEVAGEMKVPKVKLDSVIDKFSFLYNKLLDNGKVIIHNIENN